MARPIAYNTSHPLSGSITSTQGGGTISYTIDGEDRDYTSFASKKWVPSADGAGPIIFVTDSFTQGISTEANSVPLFYACAGTSSAAIIYTANRLPGSPGNYTTVDDAITDLLSNDWFIIEGEQPFEGTTANQMLLDLDASKRISYPKTQTAWYDISGNDNGGTLTNGPVFNSGGWFNFDGTNDYCTTSVTRAELRPYGSYEAIFRYDGTDGATYQAIIGGNGGDFFIGKNSGNRDLGIQDGGYNPSVNGGYDVFDGNWHHLMYTFDDGDGSVYLDGILRDNPSFSGADGGRIHYVGFEQDGSGYRWTGDISKVRFYSKVLDASDVKQNYFGSNIITNDLLLALDGNNIVSYPKSGTTWYNLTGSASNTTLYNGVAFDDRNGGYLDFDQTNDYADGNLNYDDSGGEFTVAGWIKPDNLAYNSNSYQGIMNRTDGNHIFSLFLTTTGYTPSKPAGSMASWIFDTSTIRQYNSTLQTIQDEWNYCVWKWQDGVGYTYYLYNSDGQQKHLDNQAYTIRKDSTSKYTIGKWYGGGYYFGGGIANLKMYNKALSDQEILQNYQAEQYRFKQPADLPTNGLLLYLDAGNYDSYPGSGTTWYDLSGKNAHAEMFNGMEAGWNSTGYFQLDGTDDYADSIVGAAEYRDLIIGLWSESDGGLEMVFAKQGGADKSLRLSSNLLRTSTNGGNDANDWTYLEDEAIFGDGVFGQAVNCSGGWHIIRGYRSNNTFGTTFIYSISSTFLSSARMYKGKLAFIMAYDRKLDEQEVLQIYWHFSENKLPQ